MTTTSPSRTSRVSRRTMLLIAAAVVVVAAVVTIVIVVLNRPATGVSAALEDGDFASCVEREGGADGEPSLDEVEAGDFDSEFEFWSHPVALHCASHTLIDERRERALSVAFPSLEGDDPAPSSFSDQIQPIEDYATWLYEDRDTPQDEAMMRVGSILSSMWIADAAEGSWTQSITDSVVLSDMRDRDQLPGYDAWLEEHGSEDGPDIDLRAYESDVLSKTGEETEAAYRDYTARARALYDLVR